MTHFASPSPTVVLRNFAQRVHYVDFDVKNPDHIQAYICLTKYGRQHPTIRFNLINGYLDVHSMMNAIVGAEFIKSFPELDIQAKEVALAYNPLKVA